MKNTYVDKGLILLKKIFDSIETRKLSLFAQFSDPLACYRIKF